MIDVAIVQQDRSENNGKKIRDCGTWSPRFCDKIGPCTEVISYFMVTENQNYPLFEVQSKP